MRIPDDADQRSGLMSITHSGVIPIPRGEVTLHITEGKLFLHLIYGETECH